MFTNRFRAAMVTAILLTFFSIPAAAQSDRGTLTGTVKDGSGAVVPGAKVTLTNTETGVSFNVPTNDAGDFTVPQLQPGTFNLRVEKEGFRPATLTGIVLNASATVRTDATLEVGAAAQAIEVSASAVALSTENAKTSVTMNNKLVDELPLVVGGTMRSPFNLAAMTPEAKNVGGDNGFILGGGQAAGYGTNLDGVSANTSRALSQSWVAVNAPSIEAVTEFTVDTNGFKAEYGQASGGIMSFASKSGTNSLHGTAYDFVRNEALDANNFFNNGRGIARPVYKQHDFGASAGGPVWIPKIYDGRNKTFFFFSYEAFRNRDGANGVTRTVPTQEMYEGDFRNWVDSQGRMIPIYNPTTQVTAADGTVTRQVFPDNQIPKSLFDPTVVKALAAFRSGPTPLPNNGAAPGSINYVQNNFLVTQGTQVSPNTKISVKGDHVFSEKSRISGYWGYNRSSQVPGPFGPADLPGNFVNYNDTTRNSDVFRGSWDYAFSPTVYNHFYGGGNNWKENHDPPQATVRSGIDWKDQVCLGNVPDCGQNLLNFNFSNNYSQWGGRANNGSENFIKMFADDLTIVKGKHTWKMGGQAQYQYYNGFGRQCVSGCVSFDFKNTGRPGDTNFATAGGSPVASMLLGHANSGSIDTVRYIGQQWPSYAGFIQDDWRVRPNLMLNLGLRWETTIPPTGENDNWSDFDPVRPNPGAGNLPGALIYAGDCDKCEGSRTLADSYYKAFGPRIGLAYTWRDKTVIRMSYGLSYGNITTVTGSTHNLGFTLTDTQSDSTQGLQPRFLVKDGQPFWQAPPFVDPSFGNGRAMPWWQGSEATRPPAFQSMNFSIQQQLSESTVMEVAYNGSLGSRLQAGLLSYNALHPSLLTQYGATLLNSSVTSPAAVAAGIKVPFPSFVSLWGTGATVRQALRPYPQFQNIDTRSGGGDHSGHSTYHSGMLRFERRYSKGIQFQTSYVFSKLLTDADSYWSDSYGFAMDHYNRGLEKSIGAFDVTHNFKLGGVWELPFGKGRAFMNGGGPLNWVLGGWRMSGIATYSSGQPAAISTSNGLPLFAGGNRPIVTTYDGWRPEWKGDSFDPGVDRTIQPASFFPAQPANTFGNMTRFNPKYRSFANLNENISLAKSFQVQEQVRLDFRAEFFNAFNRTRFGLGSLGLQSQTFGVLSQTAGDQANSPRQIQLALKLYF
ncbi:MAG TPA: carboxypeptidase regulatory-like domain-containing protein [Bryobacteraceae bacterium]|nr:carboxypeptidase regulatory-like domain-containing protein [Bryobacteraceae bacterium]